MIPGKNPAKRINLYISEFRSTGVENLVAPSETCWRFLLFEVYFVWAIIWYIAYSPTSLGPDKTRIGAHRHIGAYRGAWWLATLSHMAGGDGGNMAE